LQLEILIVNSIPAPIKTRFFADDLNMTVWTNNLSYTQNSSSYAYTTSKTGVTNQERRFPSPKQNSSYLRENAQFLLQPLLERYPYPTKLTFEHRLTWKPHILQLRKTCPLALNILKMPINLYHGPHFWQTNHHL